MRTTLIDWIIEVHNKLVLLPETLFLTVNVIDRFLSAKPVSVGKLQLVGVAALLIACKYEEIYCPAVKQLQFLTDDAFQTDEILRAERFVLGVLGFKLSYPSPLNFLRRCSKADNYELETRTMAKYTIESMMLNENFLDIVPSKASAATMFIARHCLGGLDWNSTIAHYADYDLEEMKDTILSIFEHIEHVVKPETAVYLKYDKSQVFNVSATLRKWVLDNKDEEDYGIDFVTVQDPEAECEEQ